MNRNILHTAAALSMISGLAMAQTSDCHNDAEKRTECEGVALCESSVDTNTRQIITTVNNLNGETSVSLQPEAHIETHVVMVQKDDEHECKIELHGDDVKAWVDGERVPKKRIKVNDEEIRILDEEGETIAEFARVHNVILGDHGIDGAFGDTMMMLRGMTDNDGSIIWKDDDDDEDHWFSFDDDFDFVDHPPVMLGISMGSVDEDLAEDLELDEDEGILVTNVLDGLPADEAGIREGDVIIEIEGESPVDAELLLDYLEDREPGDELEITILRRGKERTVDIELEEYDPEALGILSYGFDVDSDDNPIRFFGHMEGLDRDALHERFKMLQRENPEAFEGDMEQLRRLIPELLDDLGQPRALDAFPRIRTWRGHDGQGDRLLIAPSPRGEAMRNFDERFDRMEERLERLEDRIDRLIHALETRERDRD